MLGKARSERRMWAASVTMNNRWVLRTKQSWGELTEETDTFRLSDVYLQTTEGHVEEETECITQPVSEAATGLHLTVRQISLWVFCFLDLDKKSKNTFIEMYTIK